MLIDDSRGETARLLTQVVLDTDQCVAAVRRGDPRAARDIMSTAITSGYMPLILAEWAQLIVDFLPAAGLTVTHDASNLVNAIARRDTAAELEAIRTINAQPLAEQVDFGYDLLESLSGPEGLAPVKPLRYSAVNAMLLTDGKLDDYYLVRDLGRIVAQFWSEAPATEVVQATMNAIQSWFGEPRLRRQAIVGLACAYSSGEPSGTSPQVQAGGDLVTAETPVTEDTSGKHRRWIVCCRVCQHVRSGTASHAERELDEHAPSDDDQWLVLFTLAGWLARRIARDADS